MKKRIALVLLLLILGSAFAFASTFDFALMLGCGNFFNPSEGIAVSYGASFGISKRVDFSLVVMSEIVPDIGHRNLFMAEFGFALLGARNTAGKVSGVCVNSIVSLGGFYRTDNNGAGIYLGLSPLTLGSPATVKRERGLRTNIGYDFVNKKALVTFSPLDIEIYLVGTYRDYL